MKLHEPEPLEQAIDALRREARGIKRRITLSVLCYGAALLLAILGVGWTTAGRSDGLLPLGFALLCLVPGALAWPSAHSPSLDQLEQIADVRAIGPLLELLPAAIAGRRTSILSLLTRLLPQLRETDSPLLLPAHRLPLRHALLFPDFWHEREFLIAILQSLAQVGLREDLAAVEKLASAEAVSWQEHAVRQAAQACLPRLQKRIERTQHEEFLLRPASREPASELLHPTFGPAPSNPAELLRPTQE